MASTVPLIGTMVQKNDRLAKVEGIGKPFPGGALAVYVVGENNDFADWWLLDDVTIISQDEPVTRQARTA